LRDYLEKKGGNAMGWVLLGMLALIFLVAMIPLWAGLDIRCSAGSLIALYFVGVWIKSRMRKADEVVGRKA